jgi:DNA repair protein RadA/Sms
MAKKTRPEYVCSSCNARFARWSGRCSTCDSWNTLVLDENPAPQIPSGPSTPPRATILSQVSITETTRLMSGIDEFDLVCGHGIVPGCVMLVGGEPGIGKSTLALHIAHAFHTLYISGEESPAQVRDRAARLAISGDNIVISNTTDSAGIEQLIQEHNPQFVIVDSVQTISTDGAAGLPGSVSQIRESASRLAQFAKSRNLP